MGLSLCVYVCVCVPTRSGLLHGPRKAPPPVAAVYLLCPCARLVPMQQSRPLSYAAAAMPTLSLQMPAGIPHTHTHTHIS